MFATEMVGYRFRFLDQVKLDGTKLDNVDLTQEKTSYTQDILMKMLVTHGK